MTKFRFRLQTLVKLREAERERRQQQLAEALRAEQILRGQIEQVQQELAEIQHQTRQLTGPGQVNVDSVLQTNRYELQLRAQLTLLRRQLSQLADEVQRRRAALLESDRQVRVLEKLRERKREEFDKLELQAEAKLLDEVSQRSYFRAGEPR